MCAFVFDAHQAEQLQMADSVYPANFVVSVRRLSNICADSERESDAATHQAINSHFYFVRLSVKTPGSV